MTLFDIHTHTTYCDGKNTPREMVEAAIKKGLSCIGFSGHCYTYFDERYCMSIPNILSYMTEINQLKEEFRGKIEIRLGVEQDYYSNFSRMGFDYIIGSVHYLKAGDEYIPIDESEEILLAATKKYFNGDIYALCEEYFRCVSNVVGKTDADIIGHFDLISKFNEGGKLFDENHPRYVAAYKSAIDRLIEECRPFEVNTGAISRGYKKVPYPSLEQIKYIASLGGTVVLTGDTHAAENLCYEFEKWYAECEKIGVHIKTHW
ncbi:MAG: histidinol-phosphatase HisJ family protein [Ruminococcaceae bacterium]|nr:histidinol-phosphatase HisJ family protein [Oscillospiraceae bacterium]